MFQTFEPVADKCFARLHLPAVRERMAAAGIDAMVVPHDDEYQNEYIPAYAERLLWVSGFSGSAGSAIILRDRAVIFVDGRYTLQVREQVDGACFEYEDVSEVPPAKWIEQKGGKGLTYGCDPMLHTRNGLKRLEEAAAKAKCRLVRLDGNPIDDAWTDQPTKPAGAVRHHPVERTGESAASKIKAIALAAAEAEVDAILIAAPPSVAWLFNIRGEDVDRTPIALSRALVFADGRAALFCATRSVEPDVKTDLGDNVAVLEEDELTARLETLGEAGATIAMDLNQAPALFADVAESAGATVRHLPDPCALPRATKNATEQDGARKAHIRDGAAVTRFLHWISTAATDGSIDEITAARKLEEFRRQNNDLMDLSFDSISASGPNGAHCHYRVTTHTNRPLGAGELFLIDSGGQYRDGTTDITRTVPIGEPTDEMRDRFTRVLKGHIALALARFPKGVSGGQLDALARGPLWEVGLDYDHGTGHGVGSFLGVHEGPQRIAKAGSDQELLPGMILSNEPGYYKSGEYGIRIENLVIVTDPKPVKGGEREMMGFETITLAPIDRTLIKSELLSEVERKWLNDYHARVAKTLLPLLPADVAAWLADATAPI
ncbi:MAG: M24 family metallopeptidase [Alphaproteobacteria bacterium]|nr:M24 family metallopeptidase [Alphaproteobacteria bacterium]